MAGPKDSVTKMWAILGKDLELEPAVDSTTNTYLGCNQRNIDMSEAMVLEKNTLFRRLMETGNQKEEAQKFFEESQLLKDREHTPKNPVKKEAADYRMDSRRVSERDPFDLETRFWITFFDL